MHIEWCEVPTLNSSTTEQWLQQILFSEAIANSVVCVFVCELSINIRSVALMVREEEEKNHFCIHTFEK